MEKMTKIIIEIDLVTRNYKSTTATDNCDKYLHSEKTKKKTKKKYEWYEHDL